MSWGGKRLIVDANGDDDDRRVAVLDRGSLFPRGVDGTSM